MNKLGLRSRLVLAFTAVALFVFAIGGVGVLALKRSSAEYEYVARINLPNAETLNNMRGIAREVLTLTLALSLPENPEAELKRVSKKLGGSIDRYKEVDQRYRDVPHTDAEEELYKKVQEAWANLERDVNIGMALAQTGDEKDRARFASLYRGDFLKPRLAYFAAVDELLKFQSTDAETRVEQAAKIARESTLWLIGLAAAGFLLALVLGILISKNLSDKLQQLAEHVRLGAGQVSRSAGEISNASQSLSSSVAQQAAAIQQTTASTAELMAMVQRGTENAMQSRELSSQSESNSEKGRQSVQEMMQAMDDIQGSNTQVRSAVEANNQSLEEVVKIINDIAAKTKVIHDIVFQTKLLSFNASVEAARAGELGKGFAVVAEEVGNLAQMSGQAAAEINHMLSGSVEKVQQLAQQTRSQIEVLMKAGTQNIERGKAVAIDCGAILNDIVENVVEVSKRVGEISNASEEQSRGIEEITRAMSQLDETTQVNSATAHESASSSSALASEAEKLEQTVEALRAIIYGAPSTPLHSITSLNDSRPQPKLSARRAS